MERAATEDEYVTARRRLQEFDQRQPGADIIGGGVSRLAIGGAGVASSAVGGDVIGTLAGGAALLTSVMAGALPAAIVAAVVTAVGRVVTATSDRIEGAVELANYRGLWGGRTGGEAMYSAAGAVIDARTRGLYDEPVTRKQLGISDAEFIQKR